MEYQETKKRWDVNIPPYAAPVEQERRPMIRNQASKIQGNDSNDPPKIKAHDSTLLEQAKAKLTDSQKKQPVDGLMATADPYPFSLQRWHHIR